MVLIDWFAIRYRQHLFVSKILDYLPQCMNTDMTNCILNVKQTCAENAAKETTDTSQVAGLVNPSDRRTQTSARGELI